MAQENDRHEMSRTLQMAGNPRWLAPEIIHLRRPATKVTKETDVWALGMFTIEVRNNRSFRPTA